MAYVKPLLDLYPLLDPYSNGFLAVDGTHNLYWEQCGNPDGVPIVFLHGGPGGGINPQYRQFFDPNHYRIILFDQRGCGRSTPSVCLEDNSTEHLVADIETLRKHFGVERWHVFGGSWGSTLALRYAIAHADKCMGLILRGIFLMEAEEIDWFLYGMHKIFPCAWDQFTEILSEDERKDILSSFYARLTGDDEDKKIEAAIRWSLYESSCAMLLPNYKTITTDEQKKHALEISTIEAHFFMNDIATPENSILKQIDKMRHIPTTIVQGRYDVICPIESAYRLHQAWPEADYIVVPDAGHSALDPALRSRLIETTNAFKQLK